MSRALGIVFCLLMSACLTTGKRGNEAVPLTYDLGLTETKKPASPVLTATTLEVRAPLWLDTMGIDYRLLYAEPARLREYARSRWVGPPSQLLQQRLAARTGLLLPGQAGGRCLLRLELLEFAQWFDHPQASRVVMHGRLQWLDRQRAILAEREVRLEQAAETPDARGAVKGLAAVVEQLALELPSWLVEVGATGGKGKSCQPD